MAFVLNSIVTVTKKVDTVTPGNVKRATFSFKSCEKIVIRKSLYTADETCEIYIPAQYSIRRKDKQPFASMQDAVGYRNAFKDGSKVVVQLGYNGNYKTEFEGFIRRTDVKNPSLIIYCEGYIYQLEHHLKAKEFVDVDYKEILQYITAGTDIVLSPKMNDITFKVNRYAVKPEHARTALKSFSDTYLLSVFMKDNVLYAGLQYGFVFNTIKYAYGTNMCNVVQAGELKRHEGNVEIRINVVGGGRKKSKIVKYSAGDNTSNVVTKHLRNVTDLAAIKRYGDTYIQNAKYVGFQGSIETMGLPFAQHGDTADYYDNIYAERTGRYVINHVEVIYDTNGFKRIVGLGYDATKLHETI